MRHAFLLTCILIAAGCGSSSPRAEEPAGTPPPATTSTACTPRGTGEPPPGCSYAVADCCYAEQAEACAAAGCVEVARCLVLESYPAQIQCQ